MNEKLKKKKRSSIKKESKEALVLRFMRKTRNLSMKKAGVLLGRSDTLVSHIEHGRIDLHDKLIKRFVTIYEYTMEDFNIFLESDDSLFIDRREDLIGFIHKLDDSQIFKAFNILKAMIK